MKKFILFLVLFVGLSFAEKNNNALGLWVGNGGGWGIDFKHLNRSETFWDIYLGDFKLGTETAIGAGVGYYFMYNVIKADASMGRFPLYWGPNVGFGYWSGKSGPTEWNGFDIGVSVAGGISWFTPTTPVMDVSLELISPGIGMWRQSYKGANNKWETTYDPAFGLKGDLGLRLMFHVYFF